ncbi:MAG: isochorismatase family protein, partial [Alphaproteobacteria bacterium]|nr:isochorismatase family protein [Alphaproteobacteria bacterium]
ENAVALPMLVVVDPRRTNLTPSHGVGRMAGAGVVSRSRVALAFARSFGLSVSIMRGGANPQVSDATANPWIKGFEPLRSDILLERRGRSCYSSEFFCEVAQAAGGEIVLAGFIGDGGTLATVIDALKVGHRVTILRDATYDRTAQLFSEAHLRALRDFTHLHVRVKTVHTWTASFTPISARSGRCE